MVGKNPFMGSTLPKHESKTRAIWDADTIRRALDACEDDRLFLAIHLSFACSLRFGEACGLTWDCVDISGAAILNENAYLKVEKVLARVDEGAVQTLGEEEIFFTFPVIVSGKTKAQRFEAGFYAKPNLRGVEETLRSQAAQQPGLDAMQL